MSALPDQLDQSVSHTSLQGGALPGHPPFDAASRPDAIPVAAQARRGHPETNDGSHVPRMLIRERAFVPVPLTQLRAGERARLVAEGLQCDACELLNAMGLTDQCEIKVCKVGEPCIVQVRSTRLGLSSSIARQIMVVRSGEAASAGGRC